MRPSSLGVQLRCGALDTRQADAMPNWIFSHPSWPWAEWHAKRLYLYLCLYLYLYSAIPA